MDEHERSGGMRQPPQTDQVVTTSVDPADPNTVPKFADPLPIPSVLSPVKMIDGKPLYEVRMLQNQQQLHRDFPPTTIWGYNGSYPGPTIEARRNQPVQVHWINELPTTHLLPVDHSIHGAEDFRPDVRTVVHLHDGNTPAVFDGDPDQWYSPGLSEIGPRFVTDLFEYPNRQPATTLWYHDHAVGITRLNVYAGLAAFYILRDHSERALPLPRGSFEIPIVIQDRTFNSDGSLFYPPTWVPEFFGNTILANGKVWPFLDVEPRRYRFRLLNGSNARFYTLKFDPALPFHVIGVDGGLLERPVTVNEITLAPAERVDVILNFKGHENAAFTLTNSANTPFPGGDPPDANTGVIMQFRAVLPLSRRDRSRIPARLVQLRNLRPAKAVRTRDLTLNERMDMGRMMVLLGIRNLTGRPQAYTWGDATTECPVLKTTEIWRLINTTPDTHPIHLHLVRFQILDRQPYDVAQLESTGELVFTGPPQPPADYERGFKDTVRADPGMVTRLIARFGDFTGPYVWHCHILEHEDNEMMRRMEVVRRRSFTANCSSAESDPSGADDGDS